MEFCEYQNITWKKWIHKVFEMFWICCNERKDVVVCACCCPFCSTFWTSRESQSNCYLHITNWGELYQFLKKQWISLLAKIFICHSSSLGTHPVWPAAFPTITPFTMMSMTTPGTWAWWVEPQLESLGLLSVASPLNHEHMAVYFWAWDWSRFV